MEKDWKAMDSKELFEEMKELTENFVKDGEKWVEKGTKAAARRARRASLELEKLGKLFRKVSIAEAKD